MGFLLRRQLHIVSIKFSQILRVDPFVANEVGGGLVLPCESLYSLQAVCPVCKGSGQEAHLWTWLCFPSLVSHSHGTSAEQPMEQQIQLAVGQKSNWQVLADNRSSIYFGLPQAVTIQKSLAAVRQRLQYSRIHSTRDHDGREGKQQPLCGGCSGLQRQFCPWFWRLARNCGIGERVCSLERLVKMCSSEPFPTVCCHRTGLGKQLRNKWDQSIKS